MVRGCLRPARDAKFVASRAKRFQRCRPSRLRTREWQTQASRQTAFRSSYLLHLPPAIWSSIPRCVVAARRVQNRTHDFRTLHNPSQVNSKPRSFACLCRYSTRSTARSCRRPTEKACAVIRRRSSFARSARDRARHFSRHRRVRTDRRHSVAAAWRGRDSRAFPARIYPADWTSRCLRRTERGR